ncbi:hypothetical protein MAGR_50590 [Mycolicibacterium agri]|uniref:Uncharacterized protein n=1 Tax=Mycolicibacterium agri TaxID=36811 RepID=A0A7I9W8B4_MYCAG|nr:hypothetical protein MAGR_50590 [Mycolicibacterium agri]
MQALRVAVGEGSGQEVGLLLVVAFQRDAIARPDDVMQQVGPLDGIDHFAVGIGVAGRQPLANRDAPVGAV